MKDGEEFLQSKKIFHHPWVYSTNEKTGYEIASLLDEYADYVLKEHKIKSVSERFDDDKFIFNVCLSYRHDFGLLTDKQQKEIIFECKEWMRAIKNNEPYNL